MRISRRRIILAVLAALVLATVARAVPALKYRILYPHLARQYPHLYVSASPAKLLTIASSFGEPGFSRTTGSTFQDDDVRLDALRLLLAAQQSRFGVHLPELDPSRIGVQADHQGCLLRRRSTDRILLSAAPDSHPSSVDRSSVETTIDYWAWQYLLFDNEGRLLAREWDSGDDSSLLRPSARDTTDDPITKDSAP